jgi:hypothetical protein
MIVLDVRLDYLSEQREYFAIHPNFRPRKEGELIPEYRAIFKPGEVHPTWEEIKP